MLQGIWWLGVLGGAVVLLGMVPGFHRIGSTVATTSPAVEAQRQAPHRVASRSRIRAIVWVLLVLSAVAFISFQLERHAGSNPPPPQTIDTPASSQIPAPQHATPEASFAWLSLASLLILAAFFGPPLFFSGLDSRRRRADIWLASTLSGMLAIILWALAGYSLAMTAGNAFIGGFDRALLQNLGGLLPFGPEGAKINVPEVAYLMLHVSIAALAATLIASPVATRMKLSSLLLFIAGWTLFIYAPIAHWVWAEDGWLSNPSVNAIGLVDLAGGTVIFASSGLAAITCLRMLSPQTSPDHSFNVILTLVGTFLLVVASLVLSATMTLLTGAESGAALLTTTLAVAGGTFTWMLLAWMVTGGVSILALCAGAVSGAAAIAAGSGLVGPLSALLIGAAASLVSFLSVNHLSRADIPSYCRIYAVAGLLGTVLTALLISQGDLAFISHNLLGLAAVAGYDVIGSLVLLTILGGTTGLQLRSQEPARDYIEADGVTATATEGE